MNKVVLLQVIVPECTKASQNIADVDELGRLTSAVIIRQGVGPCTCVLF